MASNPWQRLFSNKPIFHIFISYYITFLKFQNLKLIYTPVPTFWYLFSYCTFGKLFSFWESNFQAKTDLIYKGLLKENVEKCRKFKIFQFSGGKYSFPTWKTSRFQIWKINAAFQSFSHISYLFCGFCYFFSFSVWKWEDFWMPSTQT